MQPKILSRDEIHVFGAYRVMEGDVEFDEEFGEVTQAWVECDGQRVSRFGDIDYATVRGAMLNAAEQAGKPAPPDMDGSFIDIVNRLGRFTILGASFGGSTLYWIVRGTAICTTSDTIDAAEGYIHGQGTK